MLVHAAPASASVEITDAEGAKVASGELDRSGEYSPLTELRVAGSGIERREIWPTDSDLGTVVLLAGGEVGRLTAWFHADDRSWWRWSLEFSFHQDLPEDWAPPGHGPS